MLKYLIQKIFKVTFISAKALEFKNGLCTALLQQIENYKSMVASQDHCIKGYQRAVESYERMQKLNDEIRALDRQEIASLRNTITLLKSVD
jgi:hypothetical protein